MKQPLDIRFLGLEASDAVEAAARDKAHKLIDDEGYEWPGSLPCTAEKPTP